MFLTFLLFPSACTPKSTDSAVETALHDVWGPAVAEDFDADPNVVEVHLVAGASTVSWVDGVETEVWAYNGQVPGPLIHAQVGQTLRVVVDNELEEETTIHWHGLRIPDDQDGVPSMMDPVQPGSTYTYEFELPDAGSFWYHPHYNATEQIERGLQGAIVIDEAEVPAVDRDRYFVVDDVLLNDSGQIKGGFANPDSMTVMMGRYGNTLLLNGSTETLTDTIAPGSVERWRVVNTSNARDVKVDIVGASYRVVASDGGIVPEPYTKSKVHLPPGQRYDFEVRPDEGATEVTLDVLPGGGERYSMFSATVTGDALTTATPEWTPADLPEVVTAEQEVEIVLDADTSGQSMTWTINGEVYDEMMSIPVAGSVPTRILITEKSGIGHPFHLHGQFFQIVSEDGNDPEQPGFKDTVWVSGESEIELYTGFENPGRWMAHCHILEHAEAGMMTEFEVSAP